LKEDVMGRCNTLDGHAWNSEINGNGDGQMEIGDDGSGRFTGKHKRDSKERPLRGRCRQHSIWFIVEETNELYVGDFVQDKRIEGNRFKLAQAVEFKSQRAEGDEETLPPPTGDEEWVATKT
jgi:hypothetical protein